MPFASEIGTSWGVIRPAAGCGVISRAAAGGGGEAAPHSSARAIRNIIARRMGVLLPFSVSEHERHNGPHPSADTARAMLESTSDDGRRPQSGVSGPRSCCKSASESISASVLEKKQCAYVNVV